jgi:hypothetical protein
MDSPVEDLSDLIPPQVTTSQPRTQENMKKAEALRRLCSPIFVDLQRGLVELRVVTTLFTVAYINTGEYHGSELR